MYASPTERVYYGVSGALMVRGKNKDEYLLGPGDVLIFPLEKNEVSRRLGLRRRPC